MSRFRLSEKAAEDLDQIDDYLSAEAGDEIAEQVIARILEVCDLLSARPGIGHRREDLTTEDVRFWPVHSYLIIYREGRPIDVG
jgi:plasmid stabilization system protein ParE